LATTKIFPITTTESKALAYIASPTKTDNRRLIFAFGCHPDPYQASRDFEDTRLSRGTGRNKVLSQHLIQSFAPGEITPEKALEVGKELADKLLQDNYQYFLAVHTDTDHIHIHCIFNNVSMADGRTFETLANQGKVKERAWKNIIDISDKICRKHGLSVIEDYESTKGKTHYEWSVDKLNLSWKAKLKYAIDQVIKTSDDFEDFLKKCTDFGVLVEYNPDHKIDLKFMLREQKENSPRAKMTRARTLGWFYETPRIKSRIENYKKNMSYIATANIIRTNSEKFLQAPALTRWADRENMKEVSKAMNEISKRGLDYEQTKSEAQISFAKQMKLQDDLDRIGMQIRDLSTQLKLVEQYVRYKPYNEHFKMLTGKAKKKFHSDCCDELDEYKNAVKKLKDWYPTGSVPSLELLRKTISNLEAEQKQKRVQYSQTSAETETLSKSLQKIEQYLGNEQQRAEEEQRRKKNGDLE
jgi:hypothetical protein